ncbi:MAG: chemotaxis protein CheW [Myxococcales bacterium]|nr:chemotaxis protein CheW [Myxococcales bacterium]
MSDRIDLQEFVGAFIVEAEELVGSANAALLEVEAANNEGTSRPRAVRDLFRTLHTIKGLAGMVGVDPIVEIAHALEGLVRAADRSGGTLARPSVELALLAVAAMAERVRAVAERSFVAEAPRALILAIEAAAASASLGSGVPLIVPLAIPAEWDRRLSASERQQLILALQSGVPVWTLTFTPSEANAARGITIATVRAGLGALGEIVKVVPRSIAASAGVKLGVAFDLLLVSAAPRAQLAELAATTPALVVPMVVPLPTPAAPSEDSAAPAMTTAPVARAVVRVELSRLDDLQDQLSLLIVSRFRLEREIAALAERGYDVRGLGEVVRIQGRQLRDLRRAILRARMVRVAEVLEPLTLLVRSLARSGRQAVRLEIEARDVELDKSVADRLLPALIHLVRNAADHGIEPAERRAQLGKPSAGTIRVSCAEIPGNIVEITVRDDGRGIDRADIARRAEHAISDDAELLAVLTAPGFTTREIPTTTSGRGLGMEIVRRIAVGDLGGELSVTSTTDVGTAFTLRVPVTMAVMDALSFQCGTQAFVVPALVVEEIIEVRPSIAMMVHRDHAIPLVSLGAILAIDDGASARKALVVRRAGQVIAFTVDRVIGRQEVVVRAIDDPLVAMPGIAGATDLGDGLPTLVLDLNELGILARERGRA